MSEDSTLMGQESVGRFFVPSLFMSRFTISHPTTLLSLLLIEIGLTFGLQLGIVGQISAANSLVALITSFVMSALSVRFNHKLLLMTGLLARAISAAICSFPISFNTMLVLFSLNGVGAALINPMTMSLTAEHLEREKRASAIGWIIMSIPVSNIIGSLAINYIANFGGWRMPFLFFILPINILSLIFITRGVPSSEDRGTLSGNNEIFKGFSVILSTKTALACLIGTVISASSIGGFLVYQASFFRQRYLVTMNFASLLFIGNALCMALGSRIAGHFMRRIESRLLWSLAMILGGSCIALALVIHSLWASLILALIVNIQLGLAFTSANSLTLDQTPRFRGTIMSLFTAGNNMGMTLGASIGGMILLILDYSSLGLFLGLLGFLAALIVYLWAHEPS